MRFSGKRYVAATAVVLMALLSAAPLSFTHAHCFSSPAAAHSSHGHHGHSHRHVEHPAADSAHRHILWLGLELVLPQAPSDDRSPSGPSGDADADWYYTRPASGAAIHGAIAAGPLAQPAVCGFAVLTATEVADAARLERAATAAPAGPLCDAARLERTGVFLI